MSLKNSCLKTNEKRVDIMAINEVLRFSWGHIIAFVALIFICYVAFMGIAYYTDGNFLWAGVGVAVVDILMLLFFIVPQLLKGTERKFKRCIIFERCLIFASPLAFAVLMLPYLHFWSVHSARNEIRAEFSQSLSSVRQMFQSYEEYAENRIGNYEKRLMQEGTGQMQIENRVEALRLQLSDANYTELKKSALKWIDRASGTTVWNVFMIGNIDKVEAALDSWNLTLVEFSDKRMSDEDGTVRPFSTSDPSVVAAKKGLQEVRLLYTGIFTFSIIGLVSGIFLYLMLLFPYVIQPRNVKSTYRLFGSEKSSGFVLGESRTDSGAGKRSERKRKPKPEKDRGDDIDMSSSAKEDATASDDYGAFTL